VCVCVCVCTCVHVCVYVCVCVRAQHHIVGQCVRDAHTHRSDAESEDPVLF